MTSVIKSWVTWISAFFGSKSVANQYSIFEKILPGFLGLLAFCVFLPFSKRGIDPHHDGLALKTAMDLLSGQTLFKDTFSQYGVLTPTIQALILDVFGPTLSNLKAASAAIDALSGVILFCVWRKFLPQLLALLAFFIWMVIVPYYRLDWPLLPWSSCYALFFQSLATWFLVESFQSERTGVLAFCSGICVALAWWCRVPVGTFLFLGLSGVYLLLPLFSYSNRKTWKPLLAFVGGFFGVSFVFLLFLVLQGTLQDWYFQVFVVPRGWLIDIGVKHYRNVYGSLTLGIHEGRWLLGLLLLFAFPVYLWNSRGQSHLLRRLTKSKFASFLFIPYLVILWITLSKLSLGLPAVVDIFGGWAFVFPVSLLIAVPFSLYFLKRAHQMKKNDPHLLAALAVSVVAVASWTQYYPVGCYRHIFWSVSPAIGPFLYYLYRIYGEKLLVVSGVLGVLFYPMATDRIRVAQENLSYSYVELSKPWMLRGMLVKPTDAAVIVPTSEALEVYFRSHTPKPILLEGTDALYSLFTMDLRNPTPFYVVWNFPDPRIISRREKFLQDFHPVIFFQDRPVDIPRGTKYFHGLGYRTLFQMPRYEIMVPPESTEPSEHEEEI